MALKNIALFTLERRDFAGSLQLKNSSQEAPIDGPAFSAYEQAKKQFNQSASKRFGFFDPDAETQTLPALIKNFEQQQFNFLSFSHKLVQSLEQQLSHSDTPIDCTVLVAYESILEQHFVSVFLLPFKDVLQMDGELNIHTSKALEANKVQFGLRVHVEAFIENETPKYLTQILSKGAKDLSDGFELFSNFREGIDISGQTKEFLQLVENYSSQLEEDKAKNFKAQVVDFCVEKDKVGEPVNINWLSEQTNEEQPKAFADYINENSENNLQEVHTDRSSLKRYMRYFGRDNSLSISFNAERFGKDIEYSPAEGSLTIKQLPKSLKIQLSGHFDKTGE